MHPYDAVHDREAMQVYLQTFADSTARGAGDLRRPDLPPARRHDLDTEAHSTLFRGEQSNSSVIFGDDSLLKVFRRVTPGATPTSRSTAR